MRTKIQTRSAGEVEVEYRDISSFDEVRDIKFDHVGNICLYNGKLVLVHDKDRGWTPIGGAIEPGETVAQANEREIKEESNMRVIKQIPIGYQIVYGPKKTILQSRTLCIVEPYGPFIADPDGDILEIQLVDPRDYKKYFDWGQIQDHIMEKVFSKLGDIIQE